MSVALPRPLADRPADRSAALPARALTEVWPDTGRLLPWMLAGFLAMLWLVPFDAIKLPIPVPIDPVLDRFVIPAIGVIWLGAVASRRMPQRPRWRRTVIDPALAAFLALALMSILFNLHTLVVVGELELTLKKVALLFSFAALFYIVSTSIRDTELHAFSTLMVVLASICAIGVIWEYRTETNLFYDWARDLLPGSISVGSPPRDPKFGRESVSGPTAHAIAAATLLAAGLAFALTGYMQSRTTRSKVLHALATTLILAACFGTIRKTGALAPIGALVTLLLYRPKAMLRLLPLGVGMVAVIQVLTPRAISRVKAQFTNGFFDNTSVLGRTDDYGPTTPDITDKLVLGRGHGSFDPDRYRFLDNEYLGRLIETGVIGTASYVLLILAVIAVGHRASRSADPVRRRVGIAAVATGVVYGLTSAVFDALSFPHTPYMLLFIGGLAVVAATGTGSTGTSGAVPAERPRAPGRLQRGLARMRRETAVTHDPSRPDLSIIVVTHNSRDKVLRALDAAHESIGSITTEWLVVDSGSEDGTPDYVAIYRHPVRLFRRENIGFAAANNVALREARGRYVLLMNPDVEIIRGTLADLVQALDQRPDVGAASVVQCSPHGDVLPSIGRFPTTLRQFGEALRLHSVPGFGGFQEMERSADSYGQERSADWLVGAFLAVRREAADSVGELDERFFLYSEEKDWCYRLRHAGWDVRHLPSLAVLHHTGGYGSAALRAQLTYSKVLFAQKHYGRRRRFGIRAGLALRHALRVATLSLLPAHRDPGRSRLMGERAALAVALGTARPQGRLAPVSGNGARPGKDAS